MLQLKSESMGWVARISGNTRQELAEAVSRVAGLLPDHAVIVDDSGMEVGAWSSTGFSHSPLYDKPGLFFCDNRRGTQYLWHTECSKAICVSG